MEVRGPAGANRVSDETLGCIFAHLDSPGDRKAVSQVCRQWRRVDANTRKHVSIANCYSVAPAALSRRFPNLQSLKIKGKPRAFEYELLVPNWGGYARPWVAEVARGYAQRLQSLWLRRMHVTDADLTLLAQSCSESLQVLKLHKCSGFSTSGIHDITTYCRSLRVLYLEESAISPSERGGEWLHELALNNTTLEDLNFQYLHEFDDISITDLEGVVENCRSLRSLKVSEIDILDMRGVLSKAHNLREHGTGCCASIGDPLRAGGVDLPRTIIALSGLYELNEIGLPMVANLLPNLKKLDLKYTLLSAQGHVQILSHCVSLEELEVRNVLGDDGLIMVARTCRQLRRIRVDESDGEGFLSPLGMIPIAQNCTKLEFLVMYVVDINNATLRAFGENCPNMKDCRFVLLSTLGTVDDLPLDQGVRCLLKGCRKLTRFALYVRHGGLTDEGMGYIGEYGGNLKWILLGCAGETDQGLLRLAVGCQSLERLEMRDCPVTEAGLATAAVSMKNSLKYMWVQGYQATDAGGRLLARARPFWNVEICSGSSQLPGQLLAYCTLAGPRTDCPPEVDLLSEIAPARENWEL
ncbi:coronatine-insensitive protein 1 [Marchantia polymorpha subsp. ruderalis]|uniref:Coronatine insensitive 1 n=1 Tax=Marchantia polymorpha TaxID=3197 RepID=A0A0K2QVG9_MARPO|nr:hypothetical protein MARPO_0025s0025 [Marchantia polymorpha]BAS06563.1 coronatine insensitive 1 [Marchantia polymorpha]BBN03813.1 hypothetical protein Mp_2g26590 [Marchantia polymorpha subsp. ruderalis]|eukprot:PTQ43322.1 hypothetical protein MARPO_0025s0025 [Marchantia polymorpha]